MRAAPAGLTGLHDPFLLRTIAAAVTHGHPSGYLTAGFLARTLSGIVAGNLAGALYGEAAIPRSGSPRSSCAR